MRCTDYKASEKSLVQGLNYEINADPKDTGYKYLGILNFYVIIERPMKKLITDMHEKLLLKSKMNICNLITTVNTWNISVIRYSGGQYL